MSFSGMARTITILAVGMVSVFWWSGHSFAADPIDNWVKIRQESSTSYIVEIAVQILPNMEEATQARDDSCQWRCGKLTDGGGWPGYGRSWCYCGYEENGIHWTVWRDYLWPKDGIMPEQTTPNYSDFINESRGN